MLQCVTTPFVATEKVSQAFYERSIAEISHDTGDEIIKPLGLALGEKPSLLPRL